MRLTRRLAIGLATVAATVVISPNLKAQDVEFAGNAQGCFYTGATACTPNAANSLSSVSDLMSLMFTPGSFDDTSDEGMAFIGGVDDNLGTMSTNGVPTNYNALSENFVLAVTFSLPTVIDNGNPASYSTLVTGSVSNSGGGVDIAFNNSGSQTFYFEGPGDEAGSFQLYINPISLTGEGQNQAISGMITVTSTPEPATMGLMATGLFGLIPMVRLRRQRKV